MRTSRGREWLPQARKFKHLRLLFTKGRKMGRWTGVLEQRLCCCRTVVVKKRVMIYLSVYVLTLIYGHDFWVRTRSQVQAA